jgi:hypothetical protein
MAGKFAWVLGLSLVWGGSELRAQPGPNAGAGSQDPEPEKLAAPWPAEAPILAEPGGTCATRIYGSVDYLLWWMRRGPVATPLVTTGPESDPAAGTLGRPGTRVLFGDDGIDFGSFSGVRLGLGLVLDREGFWTLEGSGFLLEEGSAGFSAASNARGVPLITRPFFDAFNNQESAFDVSSRGRFAGRIDISAATEFWGYEINVAAHPFPNQPGPRHDLFLGFRSLGLDESLRIAPNLTPIQAGILVIENRAVNPPNTQQTTDLFNTSNRFYGPQIGGRFNWERDRWGASLAAQVAVGVNQQDVTIRGETTVRSPSGAVIDRASGGVLAQATNSGDFSRDEFTLVPELGFQLHYALTTWLRARAGYNVIYMTSVVRPGGQIDRNIDIRQVPADPGFEPGAAVSRPRFEFRDSDFWTHGLNFGIEVRY